MNTFDQILNFASTLHPNETFQIEEVCEKGVGKIEVVISYSSKSLSTEQVKSLSQKLNSKLNSYSHPFYKSIRLVSSTHDTIDSTPEEWASKNLEDPEARISLPQ